MPGMELVLQVDGVERRLRSTLIGYEKGTYLIISNPNMGLYGHKMFDGNRIIARYLRDGVVYGFQTTIIGSIGIPFPMVFVEFPASLEWLELRRETRVKTNIPIKVSLANQQLDGRLLDISPRGCKIRFMAYTEKHLASLPTGAGIKMAGKLPGMDEASILSGRIRSLSRDGAIVVVGMEFDQKTVEWLMEVQPRFIFDHNILPG